jgi:hypothetical protein
MFSLAGGKSEDAAVSDALVDRLSRAAKQVLEPARRDERSHVALPEQLGGGKKRGAAAEALRVQLAFVDPELVERRLESVC